jgi:streptogramin lyase
MSRFFSRASLLPAIAAIGALWLMPSASAASTATAFRLPPGNELESLAAGSSRSAFAVVFHPFSVTDKVPQGSYVYEVSPSGSIRELSAQISESRAGLAGIAAAGPDSVWVPTANHVLLVGNSGVEKRVKVGKQKIESVASDRRGGVWVASATRVLHVSQTGSVSRLHLRSLIPGKFAAVTSLVLDQQGNLWMAVARGFEQLSREVIEHSPSGKVHTFKVGKRFLPTESIGVSRGEPVIQSGHDFVRLDRLGELSRHVAVPDRPCSLTETAEIWCGGRAAGSFYRAFPRGGPAALTLPEPGFRVYGLVPTHGGQFWYAAEDRDPCNAGPSTCSIDTPGTIVVGQITGTTPTPGQ